MVCFFCSFVHLFVHFSIHKSLCPFIHQFSIISYILPFDRLVCWVSSILLGFLISFANYSPREKHSDGLSQIIVLTYGRTGGGPLPHLGPAVASAFGDTATAGSPDVRTSRRPDVGLSRSWESGRPDLWTSGRLDGHTSGRPDVRLQISGCPDVRP